MPISLCLHRDEARRQVRDAKRRGRKVGLVPTMGALHQGHLSLVKAASSDCEFTVVSIFVNPTQFGPGEDLEKYPRDLDKDLDLLEGLGVDMVFAPEPGEVYSPIHSTYVQPPRVAEPLEGERRPEHFRGVATVVLKLFQIIPADVAFFGQKDYQQTRVIQDMAADLDLPVKILVCPTIRESDGLALSSRNAYLSDAERARSLAISQSLRTAVEMTRAGESSAEAIRNAIVGQLNRAGIEEIDYVAVVDNATLLPVQKISPGNMVLIAAYCGTTRLIDNVRLG